VAGIGDHEPMPETEADTCRKLVVPMLQQAGWDDPPYAIDEQRTFTDGRIVFVGGKARRGRRKRVDYLLRYRPDFPIAVVEAKARYKDAAEGLQQARDYAETLGLRFAYATKAVCDESVAGWFVSPEYRTFRCRKGRLIPRYLATLIRTPWFQAQLAKLTRGQGARRERLRPEMLLSMEIGMPDIDTQIYALEILDRCRAAQIQRSISAKMLDGVVPAMLHEVFSEDSGRHTMRQSTE